MVLDNLGKSLRESLRKLARAGYVDKETLDNTMKDIQRALLMADVRVDLVFRLTESIKKRAWEEKPAAGLSNREHILRIVYDELSNLLGGESGIISLKEKEQTRILLVGLFGSGKTTTCAKLAKHFAKKGLKVCLIGTDIWRPAAFDQLKQLGEEINIPVFGEKKLNDPVKILKKELPNTKNFDIVIVDSAGRDAMNDTLSAELKQIAAIFSPDETLLVLSADIGQKAMDEADAFNKIVQVKGVILSKMDSSAKGGGALSACASLGVPIKFVGVGEGIEALETFDSKKFASKLLGMGDLETLIKKSEEIFKDASKDQMEAIMKGDFTLKDMYAQFESMKKLGPLKKIFEMLPLGGLGVEIPEEHMRLSEEKMSKFKYAMDSMTQEELTNPDLINASRIQRVSKGSGVKQEEIKEMLNQYNMTKKMIKKFGKNKRGLEKVLKGFKGLPKFKV